MHTKHIYYKLKCGIALCLKNIYKVIKMLLLKVLTINQSSEPSKNHNLFAGWGLALMLRLLAVHGGLLKIEMTMAIY